MQTVWQTGHRHNLCHRRSFHLFQLWQIGAFPRPLLPLLRRFSLPYHNDENLLSLWRADAGHFPLLPFMRRSPDDD